ncbi:MAG: selenocysteine-specific translation elongation factor [Caldilineae bacterium]|nr:MAG: selenocysteine-specific translation elongation factor [Caldilineae bacterium]
MKVIATAGHVDHGKSALVNALSGIDPDRLREEKLRGMTIDLGFAWMELPGGETVGIVDVPGHIDFIKNMLAGVGGVDAALFVVAADEGVMPQTEEHLAILDLLEVPRGVVALTKIDLIDEEGWLELVQEEVREALAATHLADAPIIPVSAQTGEGLQQLVESLAAVLAQAPPRPDLGRPRLNIDRAFTVAGFGTVVTGTLIDGRLQVGDEVEILPAGLRSRIRGLQSHKTRIETALPGSRVAANLTGLHPDQIERGQVLTLPGLLRGSRRLDVRLRALPDAPTPLRHNMEITFHAYAAEVYARLRLLEGDELAPGGETWAQIELREPVALVRGDHFIVRRPSPSNTLGGGVIVDPTPRRRHRRRRPEIFARLQTLLEGDPADLVEAVIDEHGPLSPAQVLERVDLSRAAASEALARLMSEGRVEPLDPQAPQGPLLTRRGWIKFRQSLHDLLAAFHKEQPLRLGMPREEVKSRLQPRGGWSTRLFNALIARAVSEQVVIEVGALLALPDFEVRFQPEQQAAVERLLRQFRAQPYTPPSVKECLEVVDEDVFNALLEQQVLVRVAADVVFGKEVYDEMVARIRETIRERGQISVAECRDMFGTSRKYALGLLEHLDQIRVTRREGDVRVLR